MNRWHALIVGLISVTSAGVVTHLWFQVDLPAPTGPYSVSRTVLHLVDHDRPESFTPDPRDNREVMVAVYYPAESHAPDASYIQPPLDDELRGAAGTIGALLHVWDRTHVAFSQDAPAAAGVFPVVIFSPGAGSQPEFQSSLLADIASHGYVVAALSHPYDTPVVRLASGTVARAPLESESGADPVAMREHRGAVRVADIRFVLDELAHANITHARLAGSVDAARAAATGHSFGGAAAVEAARQDERIVAALNMDGTLFGTAQTEGLTKPVMLMEEDPPQPLPPCYHESPDVVSRLRLLTNATPGYPLVLHGATHSTFEADPTLFAAKFAFIEGHGSIEGHRAVELLRIYTRSFLDRYLRGSEAPGLAGVPPPEVLLERWN